MNNSIYQFKPGFTAVIFYYRLQLLTKHDTFLYNGCDSASCFTFFLNIFASAQKIFCEKH